MKYSPAARGKLAVDIGKFGLQFDVAPQQRKYVVNLNRLWFWKTLAKSSPRIQSEDARAQVTVGYRDERRPVLY